MLPGDVITVLKYQSMCLFLRDKANLTCYALCMYNMTSLVCTDD